ncbi:MAG: hypothetical protein R2939_03180 [Kofleriaceae bacterium]
MNVATCSWPKVAGATSPGIMPARDAAGRDRDARRLAGMVMLPAMEAVGGEQASLAVHLERARAGVRRLAGGQLDREEPAALDREIERVAGLLHLALGELARRRPSRTARRGRPRADGRAAAAPADAPRARSCRA